MLWGEKRHSMQDVCDIINVYSCWRAIYQDGEKALILDKP